MRISDWSSDVCSSDLYDTPQTRGKHSQISAYENVGRFLRLRYRGYSVPVDESRMAVSNAAVAAPSSCAAPQWQRSFSRSLSRRKRFEQVGCELAQGPIGIGRSEGRRVGEECQNV